MLQLIIVDYLLDIKILITISFCYHLMSVISLRFVWILVVMDTHNPIGFICKTLALFFLWVWYKCLYSQVHIIFSTFPCCAAIMILKVHIYMYLCCCLKLFRCKVYNFCKTRRLVSVVMDFHVCATRPPMWHRSCLSP